MASPSKILLVESDGSVRESLGRVLALENYEVVPAATPEEALRAGADIGIRLVLLGLPPSPDQPWPGLDELTTQNPDRPVVFLADGPEPAARPGLAASLAKPLDMSHLLATLRGLTADPSAPIVESALGRRSGGEASVDSSKE